MHRRTLVSGLALVAGATAAGLWWPRGAKAPPLLAAEAQTAPATAEVDTSRVMEMTLGNPDAKVEVVEYASFTCPHCATFHETVWPDLKKNYVDTGKIRFIYREVYFDRFGLWAAMLARCGDGQRYFGISDILFDKQREWLASSDVANIVAALGTIGKTAGMEQSQIDACLNDDSMAQSMIAVYQENAERDGINSTPSFMINGEKYPNMSYGDFAKAIDAKLAD